ncbi:MAG: glutamate-5-semialdehyde dehydrogenase [Candidatus Omnitrophica bacterium]|nr:glutamate-5-semialdehyde dehydrogenase [Candidatus Omnitrophota bacterium]MCM8769278.1 glutamate-5-semialdehyde dehydrogenase [Candidatus Omnitrophota bacterium]
MSWQSQLVAQLDETKQAAFFLATLSREKKDESLRFLANLLRRKKLEILEVNRKDVAKASASGYQAAFIDRLTLTEERVEKMAGACEDVADLPDPVGQVTWRTIRPNGLEIHRVRVPIGVIAIIYESRPDVTIEAAILCLKAGNCAVLRGGKEAIFSNRLLVELIKQALLETGIPGASVNLLASGGRQAVPFLLKQTRFIDLVIPRGGESLITTIVKHSRIPVIKHYKGVCHTYVDAEADINMALKVTFNAKVQRPGTCNATETLLVHRSIAPKFLPLMAEKFRLAGVEMRGCPETCKLIPDAIPARSSDWGQEYLALIIAIRVVNSLSEAIEHITHFGTGHSEAIITNNQEAAREFLKKVDAACVYHNASTRFTDGGQFGLGAEIGISTDRIHARGPMGLEELTTYKYLIYGQGQVRS